MCILLSSTEPAVTAFFFSLENLNQLNHGWAPGDEGTREI